MENIDRYKWDLTTIYKNEKEYYQDLEKVKKFHQQILFYKGKLMENASTLYEYFELNTKTKILIDKLCSYVNLHFDENTSVTKYQEMLEQLNNLFNKMNIETSFFSEEIFKYDYSKIEEFYQEEPKLKKYERTLQKIYRYYEHHLKEKEERIVNTLTNGYRQRDTYEYLLDTDLKFGTIKDENSRKVELTENNYSNYVRSNKRIVRKSAFLTLYKGLEKFKNTFACLYQSEIISNNALSKLYNFSSYFENSIYDDELNSKIYTDLIEVVNQNLPKLHEYYKLRKKILKLKEEHLYDVYVPLINTNDRNYSYEEAQKIVRSSLKIMGNEYLEVVDIIFNSRCIDVYHQPGKRSGAYSGGSYSTNPFILLNYEGKLDDVSTLAHELGHSVHSYFSRKNNNYGEAYYRIYIAEIASTVNELLLANYLLKNGTIEEQKNIYNRLLELYKGTIFRQTMFAEFEYGMYEDNLKDIPLSQEYISKKYYELVKKYFGSSVILDKEIQYEWTRIPHFYMGFYVYKYATGISYAIYIVNKILENNQEYIQRYIDFLKSGDKKPILELLKDIDLDDTKKIINEAMKEFANTLEKFKEILKK